MQDERYNGWKNYATWGVALVLDNDQGTYNEVRGRVAGLREGVAEHRNVLEGIWTEAEALRFDLADWLKDYTEQLCGLEGDDFEQNVTEPTMMARQVIQAGLAEVDWDEVAAHYTEDES